LQSRQVHGRHSQRGGILGVALPLVGTSFLFELPRDPVQQRSPLICQRVFVCP
jgi:hypothetical protein